MIGYLGDVVFEVSADKVRTFDDLKRSGSARFASHDLIGRKPLLEFGGPGLDTISFTVTLASWLGVKPEEEVETLRNMRDEGMAVDFVLNGKPQGEGLWAVESVSEESKYITQDGVENFIKCSLTLKEYVENTR